MPRVLEVLRGWLADDVTGVALGTIPANSYVTNVRIEVTEAFNASGTDNVTVGYDADTDAYATSTDVSSTGIKTPTLGADVGFSATERSAEAYYVASAGTATTGRCLVIVEFYRVPAEVT